MGQQETSSGEARNIEKSTGEAPEGKGLLRRLRDALGLGKAKEADAQARTGASEEPASGKAASEGKRDDGKAAASNGKTPSGKAATKGKAASDANHDAKGGKNDAASGKAASKAEASAKTEGDGRAASAKSAAKPRKGSKAAAQANPRKGGKGASQAKSDGHAASAKSADNPRKAAADSRKATASNPKGGTASKGADPLKDADTPGIDTARIWVYEDADKSEDGKFKSEGGKGGKKDPNEGKRPKFRLSRKFFNRLRKRDDHPLPEPVQAFLKTPVGKALAAVGRFLKKVWDHRLRFSYAFYTLVFLAITFVSFVFLQISVYPKVTYADPSTVDPATKIADSEIGRLTNFVTQSWLGETPNRIVWVNLAALMLIYLTVVLVINRFWVATALYGSATTALAVATHIKMGLRSEPVLPSDLSFISGGNTGDIWSFIPKDQVALVNLAITGIIWFAVICLALQIIDRRRGLIPCSWRHPLRTWRHPKRNAKIIAGNCGRVIAAVLSVATLISFTWNMSVIGGWSYEWAKSMGDAPMLWDASNDVRNNGTIVNFLRLAHAKTMDKPEGYSKAAMEKIAQKYAAAAEKTNKTRSAEMTDSNVIMILSETFSDPTRVPGITIDKDPMPNVRALKNTTTGGLMLSPGYGGGTANIEYQSLTGLSLSMFDDSLQSPYQELVPHQKTPYTFNQIWNDRYGETGSIAYHPFYKSMYLRDADYKKFGFDKFYTLDSKPAITHQDHVPNAPEVSDAASYQNVLDALNDNSVDHARFIQLVTMQNHLPYNDWYPDNEFKEADKSEGISDFERTSVDTYAKGINITDGATTQFLDELNKLDKPVTVIFYGDHLPGIYEHAIDDPDNMLTLHETEYFIWSNQASKSAGVKLSGDKAAYSSSNFFMSLAAEHMDAKVSPYLELLTEIRDRIPAMGRLSVGGFSGDGGTSTTYLDSDGKPMDVGTLSNIENQLLSDYRMVQYDLTAGKGYLQKTNFLKVG